MRYLVVGADGMIGGTLFELIKTHNEEVSGTTRRNSQEKDFLFFDFESPDFCNLPDADVVFICAAQCNVQWCKDNPDKSYEINVKNTVKLADMYLRKKSFVVFLSTSLVFDGEQEFPLASDPVCPKTIYGKHKVEAENGLLEIDKESVAIVRLTKVLDRDDERFSCWIEKLKSGVEINPFRDLYISPLLVDDVVSALFKIAQNRKGGIYHLGGENDISYADSIKCIAEELSLNSDLIIPVSSKVTIPEMEHHQANTTLGMQLNPSELNLCFPTNKEFFKRCFGDYFINE